MKNSKQSDTKRPSMSLSMTDIKYICISCEYMQLDEMGI